MSLSMGSATTTKKPTKTTARSRAVLRDVEPSSARECMLLCGERVKFQAKVRRRRSSATCTSASTWKRVEHFHSGCYEVAGEPHGEVDTTPVVKARRAAAAGPHAQDQVRLSRTPGPWQAAGDELELRRNDHCERATPPPTLRLERAEGDGADGIRVLTLDRPGRRAQ